jgi:hypothetical protein
MVSTVIIREDRSIVLPDKKLTRTTKGRYAIYLPITMNDLWQRLHENGVKVTVTIQINPISRYGVETPRATPRVLDRGASLAPSLGGQERGQNEDKG